MVSITIVDTIALFVVILNSHKINTVERQCVISFIPMFVASAAFWSLFQQIFTVIAEYADERLDRSLFGWVMSPSSVQSIEPTFVIIFAGVFAAMWASRCRPSWHRRRSTLR